MLKRIGPRLIYANVMVTLLAFVVLGGGTAIASFPINSNADAAPDTISGHVPPAGDHPNLISGSGWPRSARITAALSMPASNRSST
jgi:hypothetical protein